MTMRLPATWRLAGAALFAATLWTTGCVAHPPGPHGPSCAGIEAASSIEMESQRLEILQKIAYRRNLSEHEQTYLVNAILWGGLGGEQADVLIALIQNPVCTDSTRRYIANQLRFVTYSTERKRVADVLSELAADKDDSAPAKQNTPDPQWEGKAGAKPKP
jgi:hypothetical protein